VRGSEIEMESIKQQQEENEILQTVEEISKEYDRVYDIWLSYESEMSDKVQKYDVTIDQLKVIEKSIILHGIFSPNEDLKEIHTENLK
jgi:hypothetical protein